MDDGDHAQTREELARATALAVVRQQIAAELSEAGSDDCIDCGDPIPEDRRKALPSATRCVGCQEIEDRRETHMRMRGEL
jgi:phage/conjugal plasmid C-4 type zinc finger TraR family protein